MHTCVCVSPHPLVYPHLQNGAMERRERTASPLCSVLSLPSTGMLRGFIPHRLGLLGTLVLCGARGRNSIKLNQGLVKQ